MRVRLNVKFSSDQYNQNRNSNFRFSLSIEDITSNYPAQLNRAVFIQHMIKEYLQTLVLNRISKEIVPGNLTFIGGTSLRFCHGLDRLSENLDFDFKYIQNELKLRGFSISSPEALKELILQKEAETDIKEKENEIRIITFFDYIRRLNFEELSKK